MRKFIDLVRELLTEGDVVAFPGNNRPVNKLAKAQGGADIYRAVRNPPLESLDNFTYGYIECALWADEEQLIEQGIEEVSWDHVHHASAERMIDDCRQFQTRYAELLERAYEEDWDESLAGHDFWLTRNGHGAGFWDRGHEEIGEELTKAAKTFGSCDLYVGDDRNIHVG